MLEETQEPWWAGVVIVEESGDCDLRRQAASNPAQRLAQRRLFLRKMPLRCRREPTALVEAGRACSSAQEACRERTRAGAGQRRLVEMLACEIAGNH